MPDARSAPRRALGVVMRTRRPRDAAGAHRAPTVPMRRGRLTALILAATAAGSGTMLAVVGGMAAASGPSLEVTVSSDQSLYTAGDPVTLDVTVTNRGEHSCKVATLPDGVLTVQLTRNGTAVSPDLSAMKYDDSLSTMLLQSLVTVPPGGSVHLTLSTELTVAAGGQALRSVAWSPVDLAAAVRHPVFLPGDYNVTVAYGFPPIPGAPLDTCQGTAQGSVSFAVEPGPPPTDPPTDPPAPTDPPTDPPAPTDLPTDPPTDEPTGAPTDEPTGRPTPTDAPTFDIESIALAGGSTGSGGGPRTGTGAAAALLLLPVVGGAFLVGANGRRRIRRSRTAAATLLITVTVVATTLVGARAASAKVEVDPFGNEAFKKAVADCFTKFEAKGGDPAKIVAGLKASANKITISASKDGNSETPINLKDGQDKGEGGTGKGTGSTIRWNPDNITKYGDGTPRDPCASLYHELFHSYEDDKGISKYANFGKSGIPTVEVNACRAENEYRDAQGLPKRTKYGDKPLP